MPAPKKIDKEKKKKDEEVVDSKDEKVEEEKSGEGGQKVTKVTTEETPTPGEETLSKETVETLQERPLEEEVPLEKKNKKLFVIGLIVVLLIFGASGWIFYLASRFSKEMAKDANTQEKEVTVVETPEPTPKELERSEITLEILNGSGVSGAASTASSTFTSLGYEVIKVGNADLSDSSQLLTNPGLDGEISILLKDVEKELNISSISGSFDDSSASARIILGKD